MARNSSVNLDITNQSVGVTIGGGTTKRNLSWNGSGNITLTAQNANGVFTLPNQATDTLIGFSSYTANGVILVGTGAGTFTQLGIGSTGQVLTVSGGTAVWAAPSGGSGGVSSWVDVTGTTQAIAVNTGYIADNAALCTLTLPTTAAQGTTFRIAGNGAGGWLLAQNASQSIKFGNVATTAGVGGSLASTDPGDSLECLCVVANTTWRVISSIGNLTVV